MALEANMERLSVTLINVIAKVMGGGGGKKTDTP
jgi:hypothetical protein